MKTNQVLQIALSVLISLMLSIAFADDTTVSAESMNELIETAQSDGLIKQNVKLSVKSDTNTTTQGMIRSKLIEKIVATLPSGKTVQGLILVGNWQNQETLNNQEASMTLRAFELENGHKLLAGIVTFPKRSNRDPVPVMITTNSFIDLEDIPRSEINNETVNARFVLAGNTAAGVITNKDTGTFLGIYIGETEKNIRQEIGDNYSGTARLSVSETTQFDSLFSILGTIYFKTDTGSVELPTSGLGFFDHTTLDN